MGRSKDLSYETEWAPSTPPLKPPEEANDVTLIQNNTLHTIRPLFVFHAFENHFKIPTSKLLSISIYPKVRLQLKNEIISIIQFDSMRNL